MAAAGKSNAGMEGSRKRISDAVFYSYVKKPMKGLKLIKIEIYDTSESSNRVSSSLQKPYGICNCTADICMQHVVQSIFLDDIYSTVIDILSKIKNDTYSV